MSAIPIQRAAGLAYRSAGDPNSAKAGRTALLLHGYPESSYMWSEVLPALAEAGWWAIAPDLPGYGDSEPDPPATWERHQQALERFVKELDLGPVALVTHDWGVAIGLRWACDNPGAASSLTISDGGFFADRRWHDLANVLRTPDEGEKLMRAYTREGFFAAMKAISPGMSETSLAEYWKGFADDKRRMGHLELYRSGDFDKLIPYEGRVARLAVPTLILWGGNDRFAGVKMAHRFHDEIADSELEIIEDTGHFIWDDRPEQAAHALVDFLSRCA